MSHQENQNNPVERDIHPQDLHQDNLRKIYIRNTKQWVPVTEEVYLEYYRPIWRLQKEAQKNGQCFCPRSKLWVCDGDCAMCEYHVAGKMISLDALMENTAGDEFSLIDTIEDPTGDFADVLVDRLLLDQLLDELAEQDPVGKRICELIMEGRSKSEMANTLQREFGGTWYKSKAVYREKLVLDQLRKRILGIPDFCLPEGPVPTAALF